MRTSLSLVLVLLVAGTADAGDAVDLSSPDAVRKALGAREAEVRLAAVRAARDVQDTKLTAPLVKLLRDDEREIRSAAVQTLAGRENAKDKKAAARGLAGRLPTYLKEGADPEEHQAVVQALHDLAQPVSIKALLDFPPSTDAQVVRRRAMAVANVPSADAIEALIQLGSRGRRGAGYHRSARDALRYATGAELGKDPDAWRTWWREAKKDFDFEAAAKARAKAHEEKTQRERRKEEKNEERRRRREGKRDENKEDA